MLKRDDIVKQFDLVVKQEIKNHNDQILTSNLSINKIREDLEKNNSSQAQINANLASEISRLSSNLNELSKVTGNLIGKLTSAANDLRSSISNFQSQIALCVQGISECKAALQEQERKSKADQVKMAFLEESIKNIPITLHSFSERVEKKAMSQANHVKEEILGLPCEAKKVRDELLKQIEIDRIDFEGVTKELIAVKKAHFINDKKIENIYTLIERLTKKLEAK